MAWPRIQPPPMCSHQPSNAPQHGNPWALAISASLPSSAPTRLRKVREPMLVCLLSGLCPYHLSLPLSATARFRKKGERGGAGVFSVIPVPLLQGPGLSVYTVCHPTPSTPLSECHIDAVTLRRRFDAATASEQWVPMLLCRNISLRQTFCTMSKANRLNSEYLLTRQSPPHHPPRFHSSFRSQV